MIIESSSDYALINTLVSSDFSFLFINNFNRLRPSNDEKTNYEMRLRIPTLKINTPVLFNTDIMDEKNIKDLPVHYQMSDYPSSHTGNVAIAGHRTARVFLFLDRLEKGDLIYLDYQNLTYTYSVTEIFLTESDNWAVIQTTKNPTLTLTTCDRPVGEPKKRLIVKAMMTNTD